MEHWQRRGGDGGGEFLEDGEGIQGGGQDKLLVSFPGGKVRRIKTVRMMRMGRMARMTRTPSSPERPGSMKMCGRREHETDMEGGVGEVSSK